MRAWGNTTDRVLLLLSNQELTKAEICVKLDLKHDNLAAVLTRLKRTKRIYVCDWTRATLGKRLYLRAKYTVGNQKSALKPEPYTTKERSRRLHEKRMLIKRSQIFQGHHGL